MKFNIIVWLYVLFLVLIVIFSYGFVDPNFPLKPPGLLQDLVYQKRPLATGIYVAVVAGLFVFYAHFLRRVKKGNLTLNQAWKVILAAAGVLFFSFPAFSHDIFNYMATAKVAFFYQENPYLVMPMEFPGEPMLLFMHAANKYALYGPAWISLTALAHELGRGHLLLSVFTFKALVMAFYLGLAWLISRLSKSRVYSLVFFALNPLVLIETLVSGHNDVVMMFFGLLSLFLLFQKRRVTSLVFLGISAGIKYATIVFLPFYFLFGWLKKPRKKSRLVTELALAMYFVFLFLSPLREEIYSWYLIWIISLVALVPEKKFLSWLTLGFSLGLLLRLTPFLYTRQWTGMTPIVKTLTTFIPPLLITGYYCLAPRLKKMLPGDK